MNTTEQFQEQATLALNKGGDAFHAFFRAIALGLACIFEGLAGVCKAGDKFLVNDRKRLEGNNAQG